MSPVAIQNPQEVIGTNAVDRRGEKIGRVAPLNFDNHTAHPERARVALAALAKLTLVSPSGAATAAGGAPVAYGLAEVETGSPRDSRLPRALGEGAEAGLRAPAPSTNTTKKEPPEFVPAATAPRGRRVARGEDR